MSENSAQFRPSDSAENRDKRKVRGWLLSGVGILLLLIGGTLISIGFISGSDSETIILVVGQKIIGIGLLYVGSKFALRGSKMSAQSAEELMARDCRRPVLFIRTFADDPISLSKPAFWKKWFSPVAWTPIVRYEQALSMSLTTFGPMIAMGKPNEVLPELGAAKTYAGDGAWLSKVEQLHDKCALVVAIGGHGSGLRSELQYSFRAPNFKPILLCFPPDKPKGPPPEWRYGDVKSTLQDELGIRLPSVLGKSFFLWFSTRLEGICVEPTPGHVLRIQERWLPGFSGVWQYLDSVVPGTALKLDVLHRQAKLALVAYLIYFFAFIILAVALVVYLIS